MGRGRPNVSAGRGQYGAGGSAPSGGGRSQSSSAKPKPKPKPKASGKVTTPAQKAAQKKTAQDRAKKTAQKAERSLSGPPATTLNWTKPRPSTDPMRNKKAPKKSNVELWNDYYRLWKNPPPMK